MFICLLIAAEFAVLGTVFWYLYLREPISSHTIAGDLWGQYQRNSLEPFIISKEELVLDKFTNKYVPVRQITAKSFLNKLALTVEQTVCQLSTKN